VFPVGNRQDVTTGWTMSDTAAAEPIEFEIGMHWRSLWRLAIRPWVPLAFARMLRAPADGSLERTWLRVTPSGPAVVQAWRDRDSVRDWSRNPDEAHLGPWRRFAHDAEGTASWGIWHRVGPSRR
jgi:Domain of unknown function (DUF4188)